MSDVAPRLTPSGVRDLIYDIDLQLDLLRRAMPRVRRRCDYHAQTRLTARYRMAKALVFAGCALAGLAGFFIPWLVLKALH